MLSNRRSAVVRAVLVAVSLLAWLVVGGFGGIAQGQLSQVQQNDAAAFLPSSAESTRAAEARGRFVEGRTLPVLVVLTPAAGGPVTEAQVGAVQGYTAGIAGRAAPQGTWADYLAGDPIAVPSEDGEAMMIVVPLDGDLADDQIGDEGRVTTAFAEFLRATLAEDLGASATEAGPLGLNAWVTGPGGYVADLVTAFAGIDGLLLLVALGAVLLILVVIYRSPFLPFVVILTAVFALSLAGLMVYHLAGAGILVLNGQAQGILSILVVGASVDYALLLVARYREELRSDEAEHPAAAMRRALRASFEPIIASAGTVSAGLLCLLISDLASNRSLGPVATLGILSAVLGAFTFLPAVLLLPGARARVMFWPRGPRPRPAHAPLRDGVWTRAARAVTRNPRRSWIVTTGALLAGAVFIPTLQVGSQDQADVFLTDVDSVPGFEVLERHFAAGAVEPAFVIAPEGDLADVVAAARSLDGVDTVTPYTGEQAGPPGAASDAPPVVVDGLVRIDVTTDEAAETAEAVRAVEDLRAAVHAVSPEALVGGAAAEALDTRIASQRDVMVIVPVVLAVILVILMLLFRSVVAALILLAANVLSFGATLGVSALVFNHVLDLPGVDYAVPLYGFVFLVALGVDYSIFLMTRAREESLRHGTRIGIERALAVTGGVITSAGVVLAATFAALGVIPLLFLAQLAFIVAFGVLIDTFVVRSVLVPAVVTEIGDRTWWPSQLARGPRPAGPTAEARPAPVG